MGLNLVVLVGKPNATANFKLGTVFFGLQPPIILFVNFGCCIQESGYIHCMIHDIYSLID